MEKELFWIVQKQEKIKNNNQKTKGEREESMDETISFLPQVYYAPMDDKWQ